MQEPDDIMSGRYMYGGVKRNELIEYNAKFPFSYLKAEAVFNMFDPVDTVFAGPIRICCGQEYIDVAICSEKH